MLVAEEEDAFLTQAGVEEGHRVLLELFQKDNQAGLPHIVVMESQRNLDGNLDPLH